MKAGDLWPALHQMNVARLEKVEARIPAMATTVRVVSACKALLVVSQDEAQRVTDLRANIRQVTDNQRSWNDGV